MGKIFLSYRHDDARASAERIYERLAAHFGPQQVFRDLTSIPTGGDFRAAIDDAITRSTVLLVVIGRHWLTLKSGRRKRLGRSSDAIRLEILTALKYGILVVPLLVEDAQMPPRGALPLEIRRLADCQAQAIHFDPEFETDVDQLIRQVEAYQREHPDSPADRPHELAEQRRLLAAAEVEDKRTLRRRHISEVTAITLVFLVVALSLGLLNARTGILFSFTRIVTRIVVQRTTCVGELEINPFQAVVTVTDPTGLRNSDPSAEAQFAEELRVTLKAHASDVAGVVQVFGGTGATPDYAGGLMLATGATHALQLLGDQGFVFNHPGTLYQQYFDASLSADHVWLQIYFTHIVCTSSS